MSIVVQDAKEIAVKRGDSPVYFCHVRYSKLFTCVVHSRSNAYMSSSISHKTFAYFFVFLGEN